MKLSDGEPGQFLEGRPEAFCHDKGGSSFNEVAPCRAFAQTCRDVTAPIVALTLPEPPPDGVSASHSLLVASRPCHADVGSVNCGQKSLSRPSEL